MLSTLLSSLRRLARQILRLAESPASLALACALAVTFIPAAAMAYDTRFVFRADGSPMFALHFADQGERYNGTDVSTWTLDEEQKNAIVSAMTRLADMLGPGSQNDTPAPLVIGTYDNDNAEAESGFSPSGSVRPTIFQETIIEGVPYQSPAIVIVGALDLDVADRISPIPVTKNFDMESVLYHEVIHALGVSSKADTGVNDIISVWDAHLTDAFGVTLAPGVTVSSLYANGTPGTDFLVGDYSASGVTFNGEHVAEVLGSGKGLPVNGYEWSYDENGNLTGFPDLAHIELERSLMSHQSYRNYTSLMEAELAALQDIGYDIDRKRFFGFSVYGDDETIVSDHGYFARNAEGNAWLAGIPNTTTLGVGLHIYGKRNVVTQIADLLACGDGGTGIRVDGSDNDVTVAPGVLIAADGRWGTGLLVAYGKNQTIVSRGDVRALGDEGVAARFDFGNNLLGVDTENRGSWIWTGGTVAPGVTDENGFEINLDGPLVSSFDVSGRLAGDAASIFISDNAFVQNVNILSGTSVYGDIVSAWDPDNPDIQYPGDSNDLRTTLTFGLAPDEEGKAGEKDGNFAMTLYGGIDGKKGIDMNLEAGRLAVTGVVNVHALNNAGHLSLFGSDASGDGAHVASNFVNGADAVLETGFFASGAVNGVRSDASASLDGTWTLRPMPDFYASNAVIAPEAPVTATDIEGTFRNVTLGDNHSPTLDFSLADSSNAPSVLVSRDADAYSRYAENAGARSLGNALYGVAGRAEGDMRRLIAALDWSGKDGAGVTRGLNALGPDAYNVAARDSLTRQNELTSLLLRRTLAAESDRRVSNSSVDDGNHWRFWLTPYGSGSWQDASGGHDGWSASSAGILAGADRRFENGFTFGGHLAADARRVTLRGDTATANTRSFSLGAHGLFSPENWNGLYITAQARVGLENGDMNRTAAVGGYFRRNESDWTGFTGGAMIGAGRDWSLRFDSGELFAGPLAWLEYDVLRRPALSERGGDASRLHLDDETCRSVPLTLGARAGWRTELENGSRMGLDVLAAWRRELADDELRADAHFRNYGEFPFSSATDAAGRDALILQGGVSLTGKDNFFLRLDAGGAFRAKGTSANASLSLGWTF